MPRGWARGGPQEAGVHAELHAAESPGHPQHPRSGAVRDGGAARPRRLHRIGSKPNSLTYKHLLECGSDLPFLAACVRGRNCYGAPKTDKTRRARLIHKPTGGRHGFFYRRIFRFSNCELYIIYILKIINNISNLHIIFCISLN